MIKKYLRSDPNIIYININKKLLCIRVINILTVMMSIYDNVFEL